MTASKGQLLLFGIFKALREAGLPLSVRDYLDGLLALTYFREPFVALKDVQPNVTDADTVTGGVRDTPLHRIRLRTELVWLCETLWARSDEEREVVHEIITRKIGPPPTQWTEKLLELSQTKSASSNGFDLPPTTPTELKEREEEKKRQDHSRRRQDDEEKKA